PTNRLFRAPCQYFLVPVPEEGWPALAEPKEVTRGYRRMRSKILLSSNRWKSEPTPVGVTKLLSLGSAWLFF
ncbi:hypothetical protein KKA69_02350, partial [Patescibacteria group bacterium]|nr:hypothetical protein [Patescibacteria group bacterium]